MPVGGVWSAISDKVKSRRITPVAPQRKFSGAVAALCACSLTLALVTIVQSLPMNSPESVDAIADVDAPILVLSDSLTADDLPEHPSLRCTGWKTLIRDDIDEEFDHLANLQRVVAMRRLLGSREKIATFGFFGPFTSIESAIACRCRLSASLPRPWLR